jgi:DNA-binding transcriptional regulator YdaS (Cro superfamily)
MNDDRTLAELRAYIKRTSSIHEFAALCEASPSTLYSWLNGNRKIRQAPAERIERVTNKKFKKEKLIFARPSVV